MVVVPPLESVVHLPAATPDSPAVELPTVLIPAKPAAPLEPVPLASNAVPRENAPSKTESAVLTETTARLGIIATCTQGEESAVRIRSALLL